MTATDPLLAFRDEFPILSHTTYMVSNSLGAMPRAVPAQLAEYAEQWATRGVRAWAQGWWEMPITVGDEIAPLIGAGPGEVAMVPNVTIAQAQILSSLAYEQGGRDTIVMTGPLSGLTATTGVVVRRTPDDAWLDCWWAVDGRGGDAEKAVAREQLARIRAPAAYASVRFDGSTMAVARGVAARGWLGVFAVAVLPEHRRSGLGRMVTLALAQWAQGQGASAAYLQVLASNTGARALYSGLGLAPSYCYRYLTNT